MTSTEVDFPDQDEVGSELAVIKDAEPVEPKPLTPAKARALDKKIRTAGSKVDSTAEDFASLLEDAALGQIHVGLEMKSWTEYVQGVAQENKFLQMLIKNKVERKALAVKMSAAGMSQRAIAGAFGVSQKTIDRDLDGEEFDSDTVTGLDGSQQPRHKDTGDDNVIDAEVIDDPEEPAAKQVPVTQDFRDEVYQLQNDVAAIKEVMSDERYSKARKRIAKANLNDLGEIKAELDAVIDDLMAV